MPLYVSAIVIMINLVLVWKRREQGLILYCILAIVFPLTSISGNKISYEILAGICIIAEEMIRYFITKTFHFYKAYWILIFIAIIYYGATVISSLYWDTGIQFISLFGVTRLLLLLVVFTQGNFIENAYRSILKYAIFINALLVVLQVFVSGAYVLFYEWYDKANGPYRMLERWGGVYRRCFGTFYTPTLLGLLAVLGTIYFTYELLCKTKKKDTSICLTLAVICGMASSMKQYYVGVTCCIVAGIIGYFGYRIFCKVKVISVTYKKICTFVLVLIISIAAGYIMQVNGVWVYRYFLGSFKIDVISRSLDLRYDEEFGLASLGMNDSLNIVQKLIGVGSTSPNGKRVIDSQWAMFFWYYGILSTAMIILWFLYQTWDGLRKIKCDNLLYILAMCMLGIVTSNMGCFIGILTIAYIAKNESGKLPVEVCKTE